MTSKLVILCVTSLVLMANLVAAKYLNRDSVAQSSLQRPAYIDADLQPAASGHHGHGRVHIKVYRGPSDGHHAPHGFWVKQPADDERHH